MASSIFSVRPSENVRHRLAASILAACTIAVLGAGGCGGSAGSGSTGGSGGPNPGPGSGGAGEDAAPSGGDGGAGSFDARGGTPDTGAGGSVDSGTGTGTGTPDASGNADGSGGGGGPSPDGGSGGTGSGDSGTGTGSGDGGDGTPVRNMCTSNFGSGLSAAYGRLDGLLVSIVVPGYQGCNGDADHVHLQTLMNGSVYDTAVNVQSNQGDGGVDSEVLYLEKALTSVPDGPWSEGWHTSISLDYAKDLGLKSTDFTATPRAMLAQEVETRLANVNHIAIFSTGYGSDGTHLVHRNGTAQDGAIITEPLSATPHALVFHFSEQTF